MLICWLKDNRDIIMSILESVIIDEYNRLNKLLDEYNNQIKLLPFGSISVKNIKGSNYCYLAYREGYKVIYKYIGKEKTGKVKELREKIEKRKKIEKKVRELKKELKDVKKVLNGKKI